MATQKRQPGTDLNSRLASEFYKFSFFQMVSLLEALHPEAGRLGRSFVPSDEPVRFTVRPGFGFPPSDINSFEEPGDGPARVGVAFMGLIGPSGVLPQWYNFLALERARQKDHTLAAFFDLFHHRLISLFYLAWKKGRLPENYTSGEDDRLSSCLLSLDGLGTKGLADEIGLPKESMSFYTGFLSRQAPSAAAIEGTVSYLAGTPVRVEQFVERALPLCEEDRTRLGQDNSLLGVDSVCGTCVRDCQSSFRIHLGPMRYPEFQRFLPDTGDLIRPIFSLVRYMVGMGYAFDIRVVLSGGEVPPCRLGSGGQQLGWSAWLASPRAPLSRDVFLVVKEDDVMKGRSASA